MCLTHLKNSLLSVLVRNKLLELMFYPFLIWLSLLGGYIFKCSRVLLIQEGWHVAFETMKFHQVKLAYPSWKCYGVWFLHWRYRCKKNYCAISRTDYLHICVEIACSWREFRILDVTFRTLSHEGYDEHPWVVTRH